MGVRKSIPATWAEADALLGERASLIVANNTRLHRPDSRPLREFGDGIGLKLHNTDVVVYHADGTLTLDTGGWYTVTTKDRINAVLAPHHLYVRSTQGEWYVGGYVYVGEPNEYGHRDTEHRTYGAYVDGMTIDPANPVITPDGEAENAREADRAVKRAVSAYLKGLTTEVWKGVYDAAVANGTTGDCWYCLMADENGVTMGDLSGDHEHLRSHISTDERYYMVSLTYNAVRECGYVNPPVILAYGGVDTLRRCLRRYLYARLLTGNTSGRRPTAKVGDHWH